MRMRSVWYWTAAAWFAAVTAQVEDSPLAFNYDRSAEENDPCDRRGGRVWLCKKPQDCPALKEFLRDGGSPKTCSWKDKVPIICCPPTATAANQTVNIKQLISQQKCVEYEERLCTSAVTNSGLQRRSLQGPGVMTTKYRKRIHPVLQRVKRQQFILAAVGGNDAKSQQYPHMALIGYGKESNINWQCGGSLISERFVLSAAHCSDTPYGPATWARLGDLDISTDADDARPQQLRIVQRLVHAEYRPPAYYNDIVLFRLERPVEFNQYVRPTCLHARLADLEGIGIATGWGKNETYGPRSKTLVEVNLKFIPAAQCQRSVGVLPKVLPRGFDTRTMMCAGEPGKDTCQGDSGGPLVLSARPACLAHQVGITSFGPKACGETSITGSYVKVAYFLPWIESVVWPS